MLIQREMNLFINFYSKVSSWLFMLYQHQKLINIFLIAFSDKKGSNENLEFIDWIKNMKLKEKLHKLVWYSSNNWLFNRIYLTIF